MHRITDEAAHARIRKIEADAVALVKHYSREDATGRIERLQVLLKCAARPAGSIDCSDKALSDLLDQLHDMDQRGDSARFYLAKDGMLPGEEDTTLRALYAEMGLMAQMAQVLEARRGLRKIEPR